MPTMDVQRICMRKQLLGGSQRKASKSAVRRMSVVKAVAQPSESVPFASTSEHLEKWNSNSWKSFVALQQPQYPDKVRCRSVRLQASRMARWLSLLGSLFSRRWMVK